MSIVSSVRPTDGINIFPGKPNWEDGVRVSYEFKTDIITAGDGGEQRRAVRYYPRRYVEFTAHFHHLSKLELDYFMVRGLADHTILPEFQKSITLAQPLLPEQEQVGYQPDFPPWNESGTPYWMFPGLPVVLADGEKMETRTIAGLTESSVQFVEAGESYFPEGTKVYPALRGWLRTEPQAKRITNEVSTLPVRFEVEPGSPSEEFFTDNMDPPQYLGVRELFHLKPNWRDGIDMTYIYARQTEDYGFGAVRQFKPYNWSSRLIQCNYIGKGHREVQKAVDFFCRMRGRQKSFFLPTWENDVPFYAITGNGFAITIPGLMFGHTYKNSTVYKRIMLRMADGTFYHHTVDFVDVLPDTDFSILWVKERLPVEVLSKETLLGISWVLVVRFASDTLDVDWVTNDAAKFALGFQVLENHDL